jgi:hypothetical protein
MNPRRLTLALLACLALAGTSAADGLRDTPDRHGEVWGGDTHPDGRPTAQVILAHRQRNTDGSAPGGWDGLCVLASIVNALHTQGYHAEADLIWREGQRRPGGYGPDKLDRLLRELTPHLKYVSIVGTSTEPLERLLRAGVPVSATLRTAKLYNGMPIHHMVNPVHLDGRHSAWVDNNAPDRVSWGLRSLYDHRYLDGGTGWAVAFAPKYAAAGVAGLIVAGVVIGLYLTLSGVLIREAVA